MIDADEWAVSESGQQARGTLFVRFDFHPVLNTLKTEGGRISPNGKTKEEVDALLDWGAKWIEMHDGEQLLDVPAAGRPIYEDVEYVEIMVPGDKTQTVHRPVRPTDKIEYSKQYQAWKAGHDQHAATGTLLEQWPGISRAQVEELRHFKIRTVEQLAELSDGNAARMGPILALRQRARDFLERAKGNAPLEKMRTELAARDNEIETLKRQVAELAAIAKKSDSTGLVAVPPPKGR